MNDSKKLSLDHIIDMARSGNEAAEKELIGYLHERFLYLAKRRIGGEDATDIAQDACMIILRKYRSCEDHGNFEAWAYKILRNIIGNYLQHKNVEQDHIIAGKDELKQTQNPAEEIDPTFERRLLACLRKILIRNKLYARVLNLTYLGFKTSEICDRLKITAGYYYVILNRGRKALMSCIEASKNDGK
jgi:RNA polymerase sigma factor (sigma-70 family)